jgi:hypothetical protein
MAQNYDLEDQIGDLGGDVEMEPLKGRKLKHKQVYGQKEDLDDSEQNSLDSFLERGQRVRESKVEAQVAEGWIPVDREELGIRSQFYPESWEFFIRPATVSAIKNWTSVDEDRPDQVNKIMTEIIRSCVKIETHDVMGAGWAQINSWDRFWFILKVREYTFSRGESKVEFEDVCSECDSDIIYNLNSKTIFYEFPDEDIVEKYWENGVWNIDPREYDVEHDPITLYTPKLGKDEAIIDWATTKVRNKQKIDASMETFLKFLPWLLNKPSKDPQNLDRQITKIYNDYKRWSVDMFGFMDDVINNITINPQEQLRCNCPHCGREATARVRFPNGLKSLFKIETKAKKFGSK